MNLTIMQLTFRSLLGRKRALLLIPMPFILIGLTLIGRIAHPDATDWQQPIIIGLGFSVVVPVLSLIIGSSVIGSEIDDGTIVHILTKPIARSEIVISKLVVAAGATGLVNAVMMFVCGWLIDGARMAVALAAGGLVASICYCALFLALSVVSRRPVLIGLVYILLWEGLLTNLLTGTRSLSIAQFGVTIAARIGDQSYFVPTLSSAVAVIMSVVFLVVSTFIAIDRLRSLTMAGETS